MKYTVAPALTGAVFLVAWSKSSDHFKERGLHITAAGIVSLVGFILLATISTNGLLYFAIFLCTIGVGGHSSLASVPFGMPVSNPCH